MLFLNSATLLVCALPEHTLQLTQVYLVEETLTHVESDSDDVERHRRVCDAAEGRSLQAN